MNCVNGAATTGVVLIVHRVLMLNMTTESMLATEKNKNCNCTKKKSLLFCDVCGAEDIPSMHHSVNKSCKLRLNVLLCYLGVVVLFGLELLPSFVHIFVLVAY